MEAGGRATLALLVVALHAGACTSASPAAPSTVRAKQATALDPWHDPEAVGHAQAALASGDPGEAARILETALETGAAEGDLDPRDAAALLSWLVHVHTQQRDPEAVLRRCGEALALTPADPWLHYARGVALETIGDLEPAVAAFTRASELDPDHLKAWEWRGRCHALLGEHALAVDELTEALRILDASSDATLEQWGADRGTLLRDLLFGRAHSFDALGDHPAANADRERARGSTG